ncbi:SDR family NAD(P)-dependent oxidoreductase [Pseudooceanicola sediminis]|uniref:SDR family NAD(P)-dependent oxidoreductase n=1 Tax=Pseudooceanicola sediminis TaxID=2211117 RepID=A0A399JDQ9_9RHOB|nr:SDR family NAD(P)-dependent oxidoreductase [Pseudooceanicola sediminis]KAA2316777.1 SDR family NAD(P)-dependent oxidoreductase [Puniceibacterium sp. HSS470]RII40766.1 SDR family NAD(P)-dependent oxidoreductase [Pseudooceanicola sediminis]|tara:strand:- start:249557 stop:250315 length:759 start_codon:yes stop_codon:yes gene_type:complete
MPRILITGCSSGFGQAIAARFLNEGWEVVATMRTPSADGLPASDRLHLLPLDVTQPESIAAAVAAAGPLDALVNNAGVGMLNALEGSAMENARELFETNFLGAMAMTQAVMPAMRMQRSGVIVNVSSSVTLRPLPALSIYSASKAALNAFTKSFALEAAEFGVRACLVLPGSAPETAFGRNAVARMGMTVPDAYAPFVQAYFETLQAATETTQASDVANAVWRAVTDADAPIMQPAGADAEAWFRDAERATV